MRARGRHGAEGGRGKDEGDAEPSAANGPGNPRPRPIPAYRLCAIPMTRALQDHRSLRSFAGGVAGGRCRTRAEVAHQAARSGAEPGPHCPGRRLLWRPPYAVVGEVHDLGIDGAEDVTDLLPAVPRRT